MYGEGLGTISLLGDRMVMDSVTGNSRVTPVVSGDDSGGEEGDGASVEVSVEGLGDDESELDESDDDDDDEDD